MINPVATGLEEQRSRLRQVLCPGGATFLVGNYRYLLLFPSQFQHVLDEIFAVKPEQPACADYIEFVEQPEYVFFSEQLGATIGVYRISFIVDSVRLRLGAIKDIIGTEVNRRNVIYLT